MNQAASEKKKILERIQSIKRKYQQLEGTFFSCVESPTTGGAYTVTQDSEGAFYISPGMACGIGVYSGEGKFLKEYKDLMFEGKIISPLSICYDNKNHHLLFTDLDNYALHRFDLKNEILIKSFTCKKLSSDSAVLSIPIDCVTKSETNIFILIREILKERKNDVVKILMLDESLTLQKELASFSISKEISERAHDLNFNEEKNELLIMIGGRQVYVYDLNNMSYQNIFNKEEGVYEFSSLVSDNENIYLTIVRSKIYNLMKLTSKGEIVYYSKLPEVEGPTLIRKFKEKIVIVSRVNSRLFLLN